MFTEKLDLLEKLNEEIAGLCDDDTVEDIIIEADDYTTTIKERHTHISKMLERKLAAQARPTPDSILNTSNTTSSTPSRIGLHKKLNLPKLTLAKFDGDILTWQTFFDGYTSAIDQDETIDDVHKFQYLRANLSGEAYRAIEGLALTSANYEAALDLLKQRYGKPPKS